MSERYEIRGRLGSGGMSTVYRAFDTLMSREVAIKRLLPLDQTNLNETAAAALEREAGALARFQHANVVSVYALEEDADGPYVVMEYVDGENLHVVMESGVLSWNDFRGVARQCLDPLVAAGEMGLLHRDLKPGNIMLTMTASERFLVKILDFGLAKFSQAPSTQTLDQKGAFLGSIDFIAPEQLELRPLDQRTDLYSLGCVLYYALVKESPFSGETPAETTTNHVRHRCRPIGERRPDIPPPVAEWLMRLIAREPDDRPDHAADALAQFDAAVAGIPVEKGATAGDGSEPVDPVPATALAGEPDPASVAPAAAKSANPDKAVTSGATRRLVLTPDPRPAPKSSTVRHRTRPASRPRPSAPSPWWEHPAVPWIVIGLAIVLGWAVVALAR